MDVIERRETLIAAHRAGAALWPENSMTAFRNAIVTDVDFIEFDVHRTRDGVLVVHHDAELGRTAEGTGAVGEMDWSALRKVPLRGTDGEHMPLLTSVLEIFDHARIRPRLELKPGVGRKIYPGMAAEVMTVLHATGLLTRTVVTAFEPESLDEALAAGATEVLWLLRHDPTEKLLADIPGFAREVRARGIGEIAVRGTDATAELVRACRDNGVVVGAYAGKDLDFDRLLGVGLSVFTTDRPDLALAARAALRSAHAG